MQGVMEEKENLNFENQEVIKRRVKLELMIKDIQDELEGDKSVRVYIVCFLKEFVFLDIVLFNYFIYYFIILNIYVILFWNLKLKFFS